MHARALMLLRGEPNHKFNPIYFRVKAKGGGMAAEMFWIGHVRSCFIFTTVLQKDDLAPYSELLNQSSRGTFKSEVHATSLSFQLLPFSDSQIHIKKKDVSLWKRDSQTIQIHEWHCWKSLWSHQSGAPSVWMVVPSKSCVLRGSGDIVCGL